MPLRASGVAAPRACSLASLAAAVATQADHFLDKIEVFVRIRRQAFGHREIMGTGYFGILFRIDYPVAVIAHPLRRAVCMTHQMIRESIASCDRRLLQIFLSLLRLQLLGFSTRYPPISCSLRSVVTHVSRAFKIHLCRVRLRLRR